MEGAVARRARRRVPNAMSLMDELAIVLVFSAVS
jgi:hypothetical protein